MLFISCCCFLFFSYRLDRVFWLLVFGWLPPSLNTLATRELFATQGLLLIPSTPAALVFIFSHLGKQLSLETTFFRNNSLWKQLSFAYLLGPL